MELKGNSACNICLKSSVLCLDHVHTHHTLKGHKVEGERSHYCAIPTLRSPRERFL